MTRFFTPFLFLSASVAYAGSTGGAEAHGIPEKFGFTLANFAILVLLLFFVLKKPMREFFANRSALVGKEVKEAKDAFEVIRRQSEEIGLKLKGLSDESSSLLAAYKEGAEVEKKKLIRDATNLAEKIQSDAKRLAEREVKKAKEELRDTAVNLASEIAEKLVREKVKPEDHDRLNKTFADRMKQLH